MDPASIVGLISAAGTIAATITGTIKDLSELRGQYADANLRIRLLIRELSTIKASLSQINDWTHILEEERKQADLVEALKVSLEGVELAMAALAEAVSALVQNASPSRDVNMGFRAKTRYAWNESQMKEHENRLRAQVSALQLLLQAVQCSSKPEQTEFLQTPRSRQIIQKVVDDTTTLRVSMGTASSSAGPPTIASHEDSTIDGKTFDWDDEIVNSATYRRALKHNTSKRRPGPSVVLDHDKARGQDQSDNNYGLLAPSPQQSLHEHSKPLPYENSIASEPVRVYGSRNKQYLPLSSKSDQSGDSGLFQAVRQRSVLVRKKSIWSSLSVKRSRNTLKPTVSESDDPVQDHSTQRPGTHRGRRGYETTFHASIDFGSEDGLSAPPIVRAAQAGSVIEVEILLDQGSDVNACHTRSGRNALAVASHCGNVEVVRLLLQHGAEINNHDGSSMTPLHLAAVRGHGGVVKLLLQEHASVDEKGPEDATPLRIAADRGYVEVAELLLQNRAKVNSRDRKYLTALHVAAKQGDEAMVGLLIAHGAHIEAKDGTMMTPLHHACESGHDGVVDLLLYKKANIEALGDQLKTPLAYAAAAGQTHTVSLLLKKKANFKHRADGDMTALHWACYNEHLETAEVLLKKKASPNLPNKNGRTALHLAVIAGSFAVTELLLRSGATVEAQCLSRCRPLHYACRHSTLEIAQLLLGCGAEAQAANGSGQQPLHIASVKGSVPLVDLLLKRGVNIEARDGKGDRPILLASAGGHLEVLQMLLDRGACLRYKFSEGPSHEDSPLCVAARYGHIQVVQCLLDRGASVLQKDEHDWQPLRYAAFYAHPQVVNLLLKAGAKVSGHPSSGWGFNLTAQRIGFANEVAREEERKAEVLRLLVEAEAREQRAEDRTPTSVSRQTSSASNAPRSPRELGGDGMDDIVESLDTTSTIELPQHKASHRRPTPRKLSFTDVALKSDEQEIPIRLTPRRSSFKHTDGIFPSTAKTSSNSNNPFISQSNSGTSSYARLSQPSFRMSNAYSATSYENEEPQSAPMSNVTLGPDGQWTLNPALFPRGAEQPISEMSS
ncbi:MAG: hypothetical protein Q9167_001900 [Letrouitia subvulpina]